MPRAFDKFPTQRGMGGDSLHSPTRGGLPWQNPFDAIAGTAADTMGAIGQFVRAWFELDMLDEAFAEFGDAFTAINWSSPQAIRDAVAAAGKLLADIGRWVLAVIENFLQGDLTEHSEFVANLVELLAFDVLHEAWTTFSDGWQALNWAEPLTAIHPAWMLLVDFGWDIGGWLSQIVENIFGISLPGFFALDDLRAHWTTFFTAWGAINWSNPLAGIHAAWMALVDLGSNLADWALTVLRNLTGIELPSFLDLDTLKEVWHDFETEWAAINWASLTALWSALRAIGNLLRGATHWAIGVFENLTGIDLEGLAGSFGITALAGALTAWAATLAGLDWGNPAVALMGAIGAFITLFQDLGNWLLAVIESWLGWSVSAVHDMFSSVGSFIEAIIEYFWGDAGLGGWVHALESLAGEAGAGIVAAIQAVYNGAKQLVAMFGSFPGLSDLILFLSDIFGPDGLLGWLAGVRAQMSKPFVIDFSGDKVKEAIEQFFGGIPVSQINNEAVNLLAQGNFNNELTVEPGSGWSWDWSTTATGTGGSAKCLADGSTQRLYSRQALKVVNGDRLNFSCKMRSADFTPAAGRYVELAVIPWKLVSGVMTAQTPVVISTRTAASHGAFSSMLGSTYTVANDVIRLTVRITVVSHAASTFWIDDVFAGKTGGLQQINVENLVDIFEEAWNGVFGAGGAGKIWSDFVYTIQSIFGTAEDAYGNADDALGVAATAQGVAEGTNSAAYNAWYGSGGTGGTSNMTQVIASIKSSTVNGWTVSVISSNGTWTRPTATSNILEFWAICCGGGGGGDKGEAGVDGSIGGAGGTPGRWMAKQITPSDIPSTVSCTIGAGGAGRTTRLGSSPDNGGTTAFGSLCSSAEAITASIGSFVGFYAATDSRPGVGGKGGDDAGGAKAGVAGAATPLAGGGVGGTVSGNGGGNGSAANLSGSIRAGGGGGGGGGGANNPNAGGKGGNGGVPGGGGGGGGAAWSVDSNAGGNGGNGADGRIVLLYRIKT